MNIIPAVGGGNDPAGTDDTASAEVCVPSAELETALPRP